MKTDGKEYRGSTRRDNTWSIPPQHLKSLLLFRFPSFFRSFFLPFSLPFSLPVNRRLFDSLGFSANFPSSRPRETASRQSSPSKSFFPYRSILLVSPVRNYSISSSSDHSFSLSYSRLLNTAIVIVIPIVLVNPSAFPPEDESP